MLLYKLSLLQLIHHAVSEEITSFLSRGLHYDGGAAEGPRAREGEGEAEDRGGAGRHAAARRGHFGAQQAGGARQGRQLREGGQEGAEGPRRQPGEERLRHRTPGRSVGIVLLCFVTGGTCWIFT